jgi:hypothetical protein
VRWWRVWLPVSRIPWGSRDLAGLGWVFLLLLSRVCPLPRCLGAIMSFDPFEGGSCKALFEYGGSCFEELGVFNSDPSVVFPGAKHVGEAIDSVHRVRDYY